MNESGPGQHLFGFVRHWSRRAAAGDTADAEQGRLVLVTEAVNDLTARGEPATVNAIARQLGLDQSGASRLVKIATEAGHLDTVSPAADRRRRESVVTTSGRAMLEQAHAWQEQIFADLTTGWTERRRQEFTSAMADLVMRSHEHETGKT